MSGELDAEVQDQIESDLFAEWLANRRRDATIEWAWGIDDVGDAPETRESLEPSEVQQPHDGLMVSGR